MEVNYCLHVVAVIHKSNVISDSNIAVLRRRWWQLAREIPWGSVHLVPQTSIEHGAFAEARFLVRRESILFTKAGRRIILMLVVPVVRHLLIVFAELLTVSSILAIPLSAILSNRERSKRGE
jgi:hypothetical protein